MRNRVFTGLIAVVLTALSIPVVADKKPNDVVITGYGRINGGDYDKIDISGAGKIDGDVNARELRVSGKATILGKVKARLVHSSGSIKISGMLDADSVESSGSIIVNGKLVTKEFHSSGSAHFDNLEADSVSSSGSITSSKNVEAKSFTSTGQFDIAEKLDADRISVKLAGDSNAKEIRGKSISIKQYSEFMEKFWKSVLTADKITGDDIYLENTNASLVKGRNVRIGPRCSIDRVDYKEKLEVDPGSKVTSRDKVIF